jgi:Zn-dependent peptidase ImmA (M78 family)
MHRAVRRPLPELEAEANAFAGALLLPRAGFVEEVSKPVTISGLAPLKPRWGVSLAAIINRCRSVNLVDDRQYRYLFEQLTTKGWRLREPANLDVPIERPRGLSKMAEMLFGNPIDMHRLAQSLRVVRPETAREILRAHTSRDALPRADERGGSQLLRFAVRRRNG